MNNPLFLRAFLALALFFFCSTSHAQAQTKEAFLKVYDSATIHSIGKFYIKGGNKLRFGDLKNELTTGLSKELYRKAATDRIWGGIFTVTGIAALVSGILIRKSNASAGNILSGAAIVLNIGSLHFNKRSTEQTDRAIWQRNREILFGN